MVGVPVGGDANRHALALCAGRACTPLPCAPTVVREGGVSATPRHEPHSASHVPGWIKLGLRVPARLRPSSPATPPTRGFSGLVFVARCATRVTPLLPCYTARPPVYAPSLCFTLFFLRSILSPPRHFVTSPLSSLCSHNGSSVHQLQPYPHLDARRGCRRPQSVLQRRLRLVLPLPVGGAHCYSEGGCDSRNVGCGTASGGVGQGGAGAS